MELRLRYRFYAGIRKRPTLPGEGRARFVAVAAIFFSSGAMAGMQALIGLAGNGSPCNTTTSAFGDAAFAFGLAFGMGSLMLVGHAIASPPKLSPDSPRGVTLGAIRQATHDLAIRSGILGALIPSVMAIVAAALGSGQASCTPPFWSAIGISVALAIASLTFALKR